MRTRKIIKKILPHALLMAAVIVTTTSSWQAFANESEGVTPPDEITDAKEQKKEDAKTHKKADTSNKDKKPNENSAQELKSTSTAGARIKELMYDESNVYVIRTKYGYQTNIVFDPKEDIQTISVGDRSLWQIIPAGNRLFIRPMAEDITTNMTLLTNKRSYEFELKSVSEKNESNVYVVRFSYPEKHVPDEISSSINDDFAPYKMASPVQPVSSNDQHVLKSPSETSVSPASIGLLPIRFNYSYTYAGPDAIAPLQVYDDGKTTFIKYKTIGKSVPNAFIINENAKESRVPVTVRESSLVIDGVASEIALRSSDGEIRIYNESLNQR